MPRFKFKWANLPEGLLEALCRDLLDTQDSDPAAALQRAYGARPKVDFIRDAWPTLLDSWLPTASEPRERIVQELQAARGDNELLNGGRAQLGYLKELRNAKRLREIVWAELVAAGEIEPTSGHGPDDEAETSVTSVPIVEGQDYASIVANIRSNLTGDPAHDGPLLLEYSDQYRQHPVAREILREIGRMLHEVTPPDGRAEIDEELARLGHTFETGLANAEAQLTSGDAVGARRALEGIIEYFDPGGDSYPDDAVTEYRVFPNAHEAALYQKLYRPTRQVRATGFRLVWLWLLYGSTLLELGDLDAAETALRRAMQFNPVHPTTLYELAEVSKLQHRWDEFHELSTRALEVGFSGVEQARAYRNLGLYYTEHAQYDLAVACYLMNGFIEQATDPDGKRAKPSMDQVNLALEYIQTQAGRMTLPDLDTAVETLRTNGIQVGPSDAVLEVMAELDDQNNAEQDDASIVSNAGSNLTEDREQDAGVAADIVTAIRSNLTGDREQDNRKFLAYVEQYRNHPLAREILREMQLMWQELYAGAHPDDGFETGLADAYGRYVSGDAIGSRHILEAIINEFGQADSFADDAVSEYRLFANAHQKALYHKLFRPTRQVRELPRDMVHLYLQYGSTLVELRDLDAAETALRTALRFNPVNPQVMFELGAVFQLQQRWDEFRELSTYALSVSFGADDAARAHRNLGYYNIEQRNYEVAAACYVMSGLLDKDSLPRCADQLMYIEQQTGKPTPAFDTDAVKETLRANGIQVDPSDAVREVMAELDGQDNVEQDIIETVRTNIMGSNVSSGQPEQLAALLLSCSGQYRNHPKTPETVRRIGWMLSDEATPDLRAKLSLAIMRLAERETAGSEAPADESSAGLAFIRELELWATHPGPEGTVGVTHRNTGVVVAQYDFSEKSVTLNKDLPRAGSNFPPGTIRDAILLLGTYVGELTFPERA